MLEEWLSCTGVIMTCSSFTSPAMSCSTRIPPSIYGALIARQSLNDSLPPLASWKNPQQQAISQQQIEQLPISDVLQTNNMDKIDNQTPECVDAHAACNGKMQGTPLSWPEEGQLCTFPEPTPPCFLECIASEY